MNAAGVPTCRFIYDEMRIATILTGSTTRAWWLRNWQAPVPEFPHRIPSLNER